MIFNTVLITGLDVKIKQYNRLLEVKYFFFVIFLKTHFVVELCHI